MSKPQLIDSQRIRQLLGKVNENVVSVTSLHQGAATQIGYARVQYGRATCVGYEDPQCDTHLHFAVRESGRSFMAVGDACGRRSLFGATIVC